MADSQQSIATVSGTEVESAQHDELPGKDERPRLTLGEAVDVFVLPTHLSESELLHLKDLLRSSRATLADDVSHAHLILTAVETQRRAEFELRVRGIKLDQAAISSNVTVGHKHGLDGHTEASFSKRRRSGNSDTHVEGTDVDTEHQTTKSRLKVVRLQWLHDCVAAAKALPFKDYLILQGTVRRKSLQTAEITRELQPSRTVSTPLRGDRSKVFENVVSQRSSRAGRRDRNAEAVTKELAGRSYMPSIQGSSTKRKLTPESTTEIEDPDLPEMPEWVKENRIYACQRSSPHNPPNRPFIMQLEKIRLARTLIGDEIGVRAYSTVIASIASYPYELSSTKEVLQLPGCNDKTAVLFQEYRDHGRLKAADEVDKDPVLSVIHSFYKIWGVGATTAREFYHDRGWRDYDDIIEFGWNNLSRHQQIGLKFFDEFERKMDRAEVEYIASIVTYHARKLVDGDVQCAIAGGYRRGNKECGDVDIVLSHPEEEATRFLVTPLIQALEDSGWITHTLIVTETTSNRDQDTLPLKSSVRTAGFDTLDKALVVWQDPNWSSKEEDLAQDPKAKNPNIHRRVDIIIAPWRVVGCAVLGWTSGTTFQRDMRRYSRKVKGWKFDSSGVRDLGTGKWVDLERWHEKESRAKTWLEAEKRVFRGLDLAYIPPEERNTG